MITAVGYGVTGYGDAVIVWSQARGTYTQYVAVPADTITLKPERLSFAEAAGVAHASLAAWNLLIDAAKLRSAQTVLVLGGGGGVGSAAVQIATNRARACDCDRIGAQRRPSQSSASTKQIAEWSQVPNHVTARAIREGKVLYETHALGALLDLAVPLQQDLENFRPRPACNLERFSPRSRLHPANRR